jgi:pimeloyl-ACP methyl ester carboxylesterase
MQCLNLLTKIKDKVPNSHILILIKQKFQFSHLRRLSSEVKLSYTFNHSPIKSHKNLIFLHGLFGSKNNWGSISNNAKIKNLRNTIRVDLRNHGLSDHHNDMTYELMAHDIHRMITNNFSGDSKFTVLGHSMGGKVALAFSCLFPHLVDGLLILDTSPEDYNNSNNIFTELKTIVSKVASMNIKDKTRNDINKELEHMFGRDVGMLIATNIIVSNNLSENHWRNNIIGIKNNINNILGWEHLKEYYGSVRVIAGENSMKFSVENYKKAIPNIKETDIRIIKNAGHWVHADKPIEVTKEIINYIEELDNSNYSRL